MIFETVGLLPVIDGRWFVRTGGGHIWFIPEFAGDVSPYVYYNGALTPVVDAGVDAEAPLIMPMVGA